jgi:hypothetical protein
MLQRLISLLVFALAAPAQTSTSAISGTVTDPSGAAVPGAVVSLRNEATGIESRQTTTEAGVYSFPALNPGSYALTVEAPGFKTRRLTGITLTVNTPITLNLSLEVGETREVISVEATAEMLETSNAAVGNVVTQKAILELPLNGRNPLNFLVLEPGVVQRSAGAAGTGIHVNGSRDMAHNVTIDGIEANESSVNNPLNNIHRLNPDNTQEYRVTTSNATAEEGRNSGASVSIATRSGTNEFHGALFEFFRNTHLNANEFYANLQAAPKPDIKLNQYGFQLGGPMVKNRTFFFVSWQGQKINFAQPVDQSYGALPLLYTASARAGIFRYFVEDPNHPLVINGETITRNVPALVDPNTGALHPEVRPCASPTDARCVASYHFAAADPRRIGVDPVIAKLLSTLPLPNSFRTGDGLNTATYIWNPPVRVRGPHWMWRIDHRLGDNDSVFVRWLQGDQNTLGGDPNNGRPQLYPGLPPLGEVFRANKNLAVSHRKVLSARVINELTVGFARFAFLFTQGEANPAFPNVPPYARGAGTAFNNLDPGILNTPRTYRAVTTPQILDNLTIVSGAHIIKTGFNFRFYRHNDQRGQPGGVNVTPLLTFDYRLRMPPDFVTPAVARPGATGIHPIDNNRLLGTVNDILGIPARLSQTFLGDLTSDAFLPYRTGNSVSLWSMGHRLKQYNAFIQDEWKLAPSLTLNAGLRWEFNPPPKEAHGRVYVPNKPVDGSAGLVTFVKAETWYQRLNLGALAPRLALAWAPGRGKTVFRTGYGIAYDTLSSFQVTAVAGRVPGLTASCSSTVGGATTPGCTPAPDLRIAEGFPSELPPPSVKPSQFLTPPLQLASNAPNLIVFDQNLKVPTVHQWNFNIQRELPRGFLAQIGYVGRRGTRLFRAYDLNQINSDPILPSFLAMQRNVAAGCQADGSRCPAGMAGEPVALVASGLLTSAFVNSATTLNELRLNAAGAFAGRIEQTTLAARLRPNQQFNQIAYVDSGGDSYYHGLQTALRKRFSDGLLLSLTYTFSKSIDNQSVDPIAASSGGGLSTTNSRTPTDIRNWRNERARSDFDRSHVLTGSWVWDLPVGRGQRLASHLSGALNQLLGGWSFNGILTAMTGEPFSVRSGSRTANASHESNAVIVGPKPEAKLRQRPGAPGPVIFLSTDGFALPGPGQNGAGRNIFTGPSYWNLDLSVTKRFTLSERLNLALRTEFFNALNHPNFDNPRDATVGSPSIQSTNFGHVCCATVAPASTRAIIQTGESARVIQLALRLSF